MLICGILSAGFLSAPLLRPDLSQTKLKFHWIHVKVTSERKYGQNLYLILQTMYRFLVFEQTWLWFIVLIMSTGAPESWSDPGLRVGVRHLPSSRGAAFFSAHAEDSMVRRSAAACFTESRESDSQTLLLDHPSAGFASVFPPTDLPDLSAPSHPSSSCIEVIS